MTLTLPLPKSGGHTGDCSVSGTTSLPAVPVVTGPGSYCLLFLASSPRLAGLK